MRRARRRRLAQAAFEHVAYTQLATDCPAGCADHLAAVRPIRPRQYIRFARAGGRPPVPFIISIDLPRPAALVRASLR